jgi:hypothetical protein
MRVAKRRDESRARDFDWTGTCGSEDNLDVYVEVLSVPAGGSENSFNLSASNQKR